MSYIVYSTPKFCWEITYLAKDIKLNLYQLILPTTYALCDSTLPDLGSTYRDYLYINK